MLKIGDFSQLVQVSVRMLRHYDELGLLPPSHTDPLTGYRYYQLEQLPRLNRILALKETGLSLKQISDLLQKGLPDEQLKQMLQAKQQTLRQQRQGIEIQLNRLAGRLKQLEQAGQSSSYDVIVKPLSAYWIAFSRLTVPTVAEMPQYRCQASTQLDAWLNHHLVTPIGYEVVLYHLPEYIETDIDMAFAIVIPAPPPAGDTTLNLEVTTLQLPEVAQAASVIHRGMMPDIPQAVAALFTWMGLNGYSSSGPIREVHLFGREMERLMDRPVVVELQVPIEPLRFAQNA